jgi:acyl carrier protein
MHDVSVMSADMIRSRLLELLTEIAPDVDPATVISNRDFRDQFDFDSMDLLSFAIEIHKVFGVDVPERDYQHLLSLDKAAGYLQTHKG